MPTHNRSYTDLELHIRPRDAHGYPIVLTVNGSQESEVAYLSTDILLSVSSTSSRADGETLYSLLFRDPKLLEAWSGIRSAHPTCRVRLRISRDAPELHAVPWELLREPASDHPAVNLATDPQTPFSRYLAGDWEPGASVETKPIRVLVAVAAPTNLDEYGLAPLSPQAEIDRLAHALAGSDQFELVPLDAPCTLVSLADALEENIQILHFVGHGSYDAVAASASLVMADENGAVKFVSDQSIAAMIHHHQRGRSPEERLRLITLMSCQSANASTGDAFRGLGPRLIAAEVPAVIAMHDDIAVDTADVFATEFYTRLAEHGLVDVGVNQARHIVRMHDLPGHAVPILFMRLRNGRLFGKEPTSRLSPHAVKFALAGMVVFLLVLTANLVWFAGPTVRNWFAPPLCHDNPLCVIVTGLAPPDSAKAQQLTQQIADEISLTLQHRGTDDARVLIADSLFDPADDLSAFNDQARDDQARRLGQKEDALLVIWGSVTEDGEHLQVNFELVDLLGVADAQGLRPQRAEPIKYDRVTERVICSNCLDVTAGEVGQRIDIIAYTTAGLLHYADQPELAYDDFMSALYCAGEPVDSQLVQVLDLDCAPTTGLVNWGPGLLYYYAGKSATINGNYATGIGLLQRAAAANPLDPAASIGIAAAYQAWLDDKQAPQALTSLTEADSRLDNLLLLTRSPAEQADLMHNRGLIDELREDWTTAAESYLNAARLFGDAAKLSDLDERSAYVSLVQAGHAQRLAGAFGDAETTLTKAVALDKAAPWAYLELAQLAWSSDADQTGAERWLAQAEQVAPDAAYVAIHRADLCEIWGDLACAADAYARALDLRPISGWLSSVVGDFYRHNETAWPDGLEQAAQHYENATRLRPADPWVHERLAYVRAAQGDDGEAIRLFTRAVDLTLDGATPTRLCANLSVLQERSSSVTDHLPTACQ